MTWTTGFRSAVLAFCVAIGIGGAVLAQGASVSMGLQQHDTSIPLEITSEELELDQINGTAIFTGNVIVSQGAMTMTCSRMRVEYAEDPITGQNEIQIIRLFGGVTFVSPEEAAESDWAVYTLANETMVMHDNVLVTQGTTAISSDKLTYNLDTGDGLMEGNVKTVLQSTN